MSLGGRHGGPQHGSAWRSHRRWHRAGLAAALLALCAAAQAAGPDVAPMPAAAARPAPAAELALQAARLQPGERLPLDGTLDHPAWQRAPVHRDFIEKAPVTGGVPAHATEARVLFDAQALYVGVRCLDDRPEAIRAPLVRHDFVNRTQDFVVVYVDAIGARQSAQFFRVNAAGSTADGMHTAADDSEDFAPDFDWDGAARRDERGWTAVLRIPFASLRFTREHDGPWRVMIGRRVPREQFFLHTSVLVPREAPSFIATLQPLQGLQLPDEHQFLTLRPSLTWRRERQQQPGEPATQRTRLEATLDVKWRPLPELVVDATLNPDFSQVAIDVPQLSGNTSFALSLTEKRPFFYESSDLLRSPTDAVYTRSLIDPRAGLRATWRGARLAASAFAIDDRGGGYTLLPRPFGTGLADQPASHVLVARARADGGALQWGGLAASRQYADDRGSNLVAGPDLAWQIDDTWRLRAQWLGSSTSAWSDGGLAPLRREAARTGHRAYLKLSAQQPEHEADLVLDDIAQDFRDDLGFVNQAGVTRSYGRLARGWHGLGPFNEFWFNLEAEAVRAKVAGQLVSRSVNPGVWLTGAHNLEASLYWHGGEGVRVAPGQPLLQPRFWKASLVFTPAPWMPFLTTDWQWGRLADMQAGVVRPGASGSLTLTTRPLARLEFEPGVWAAWLRGDGQRVYRETAVQMLAVWHLDAQQSLRAIWQRTSTDRRAGPAAPGLPAVQAGSDAGDTGTLTYAWRRSAGSVLYVGAGRNRQGLFQTGGPARGNEVFVKLQLDSDDLVRSLLSRR